MSVGTDSALSAPQGEACQRSWLEARFCFTEGWAEPSDFVVAVVSTAKIPIYPELGSHMVPERERPGLSTQRGTTVTMASMSSSRQKMPVAATVKLSPDLGPHQVKSGRRATPSRALPLASPVQAHSVPHTPTHSRRCAFPMPSETKCTGANCADVLSLNCLVFVCVSKLG